MFDNSGLYPTLEEQKLREIILDALVEADRKKQREQAAFDAWVKARHRTVAGKKKGRAK